MLKTSHLTPKGGPPVGRQGTHYEKEAQTPLGVAREG